MALEIIEQLSAISELLNELKSQNLIPPVPGWAPADLSSLIEAAILRFPMQLVVLDNRKGRPPKILIGVNRLGAFYWFLEGCFPLDAAGLQAFRDLAGKRVKDIGPYRVLLEGRPVRVCRVQSGSDDDVALLVRKLEARADNPANGLVVANAPKETGDAVAPALPKPPVLPVASAPAAVSDAASQVAAMEAASSDEDWIREENGGLVMEISEDGISRLMAKVFGFTPHDNAVLQAMEKLDGNKIGEAVAAGAAAGVGQVEAAKEEIKRQLLAMGRPAPPISLPKL